MYMNTGRRSGFRIRTGALLLALLLVAGACGKKEGTVPSETTTAAATSGTSSTDGTSTPGSTSATSTTTQDTTTPEPTTAATTVHPLSTVTQVDGTDGWYRMCGEPYVYPVTPWDTPEIWESFTTREEMLAALQIPEGTLSDLQTDCLIGACVEYPLNLSFMHEPSLFGGVEQIIQEFNGLQELYQRPDAAFAFIAFYRSINLDALFATQELAEFRLAYVEFLLCGDGLISSMTADERIYLLDAVNTNLQFRLGINTGIAEDTAKALLLGRLLETLSPDYLNALALDPDAQQFLDSGSVPTAYESGLKEFIQSLEPYIQSALTPE